MTLTNYEGGRIYKFSSLWIVAATWQKTAEDSNEVFMSFFKGHELGFGSGGRIWSNRAQIGANPLSDLLWHYHSGGPGRRSLADRPLARAGSGGGHRGRHFLLPSWNSLAALSRCGASTAAKLPLCCSADVGEKIEGRIDHTVGFCPVWMWPLSTQRT